ncbi:putative secreted protein [Sorangium cellulosum So ce56]|uniref:Secreted protein n=2 Tax=Sorangium cellulosum TaxID=56 RepID=A9G9T6_SORC5|nr:putative secreted protein [Sorangium cellulosum So ce56]
MMERSMTRMKLLGMLMVGLALVACGDDGEGSNPSGTSSTSGTGGTDGTGGNGGTDGTGGNGGDGGTDGTGGDLGGDLDDKQLGDLTDEESQAVCDEIAASASDISKEDACEFAGLVAAALGGADCATAKEECMNDPEEPSEEGMCPTDQFAGCTATVAEYKACTGAQIEFITSLTCESTLDPSAEPPPECQALSEKCPELGGEEP